METAPPLEEKKDDRVDSAAAEEDEEDEPETEVVAAGLGGGTTPPEVGIVAVPLPSGCATLALDAKGTWIKAVGSFGFLFLGCFPPSSKLSAACGYGRGGVNRTSSARSFPGFILRSSSSEDLARVSRAVNISGP